ncbi:hypothetical protein E8E11_011573 [Didymella keratinophila]|nr:hypothetical protein E8E11_011573 [Didymella keratinophila]
MKFSTIAFVLLALAAQVLSGGIQLSEELSSDTLHIARDVTAAARGALRSGHEYPRADDKESRAVKEITGAARATKNKVDKAFIIACLGVGAGVLGTLFTF